MVLNHNEVNEELQNILSWIGEMIDEGEGASGSELNELYEWLEQAMVDHYEAFNPLE